MIKTNQFSEVIRFDLARTIARKGRYWATAYLVDGLLVDTGCAHTANELVGTLEHETLTHILNTHSHEDHIGADGALQRKMPGLQILSHPLALPVLRNPRKEQPLQPYRRLLWGWPEPSTGQPVHDGDFIKTNQFAFQVIYTPGHSRDHLCLYEPERGWLFSGDLFVGGRDRALRVDYDIWEIISSLKIVAALPISRLFPGCARVRENPNREIVQKIDYLEETGQRVLALHEKGWSVNAIVRSLFPKPMWIEAITLWHFSRRGLVNTYLRKPHSFI
jgi:glyoxylase-like metal-dependent hydrolase (beta-lactamase superfamily II)